MGLTVDLTAAVLVVLTVGFWRIQRRQERRDRAFDLYRQFESETMKRDRRDAWAYVRGWKGPVVPIGVLAMEDDQDRLDAYRACFGVLTFFAALRSLLEDGHVDRRIAIELFEDARSVWAERFAPLSEPDGSSAYLGATLSAIQEPLASVGRAWPWVRRGPASRTGRG